MGISSSLGESRTLGNMLFFGGKSLNGSSVPAVG